MATEGDVKDPISTTLNEVEHKEIISDFSNTIINKIVTEEKEKVESCTSEPSETVTILLRTEKSQVTNDVENEKVEIDYEGHTGSTGGELFLQPPPIVTGFLKKDKGDIQWNLKQGAHSLQEENEGIANDVIVSVGDVKTETWQGENSGEGKILVQGNEPTEEILESSKTGAAEQIQEIIESPYAEINTYMEKEESVDHLKEVIDEASRINIKIIDDINKIPPEEQNSLPTANMDEKASTELTYFPNEEADEDIDHDKVHTNAKGQADETFEVHQEEKHEQGNSEADKGPEGTQKIEMTPSTKAPVYGNEDPEQQEKDPNAETETATVEMLILGTPGIERYQTSIEVETNAIKELDPSSVLEEEEEEQSLKIPITTEKEVREPTIKCTGKASDKEFTEEVEAMTPNYETLSEGLNKQVTTEGEIASQEKNLDDGKASSDPELSKDEIDQPTASKDEKPLDILEEEELSNMAPERDKTGNNMPVKDDQLQFEGCSITVADNEETVFEKHVFASSSSKEDIEIEKRAELDVEAQVHVSEAEAGSSNTVTEKVISYTEGLRIPLEQNIESLDKSKELKPVVGSLENDDEINTTEQNNLEESYNNQTGSTEQTTVQDNKGDENDTNEDTLSSSVGQEELGKAEEKTLTEEVAGRLHEVDENDLQKEKTQKEENMEDLHVMAEVNETLKQTVRDSTTSHDHEIYFDSGFSEGNIAEDLAQHAEELSMSTKFEQESLEAVEKPNASEEKIRDEKAEQEINYDANNDDAHTMIIEETFLKEAQSDHYSLKEANAISCEKHENVTIERSSSIVSQPQVVDPQSQYFERVPDVETPLAHETRQLQIDEDPKDGDDQSAKVDTNDYAEDLEVVPSLESLLMLEKSKNTILEQLVKVNAELNECEIALEFDDQVHERSFEALQSQSVQEVDKIEEFEKISELPTHETRLLHVDPNDGNDNTANKAAKGNVPDLEVAQTIESSLVLEENKKAIVEKLVKDQVHLEGNEITTGSYDQVQEKSLEAFPDQTTRGVDEVEEIEKISEPQSQDFQRVADVQTPPARETELLNEEEIYKNGANDTADKSTDIEDYVADIEVVHAIESSLALEESKNVEKESPEKFAKDYVEQKINETDDRVLEKSLEDLPCQSAQHVGLDEVKEIEKISEPQSQDFERIDDVQTPSAYETEQLIVYPKDGDDDTANKVVKTEEYVAELEVIHNIESPLALEERKNATLESEIALGFNDQVYGRPVEDYPWESLQGVTDVKEFEKISEPQCQDSETVVDVQTPTHETKLLHVDLNDGDDDIANKGVNINDYVADIEMVPTIESPLELEECEKAPIEKLQKDKVNLEESEIALGSDDQVQERSLEVFPGQTAPEVDEVEEIEKISEPQSNNFERVYEVETLDVQTPPARETELLDVDEIYKNGANDTADKGTNIENYVADLEVVHAIESPLALEKNMNVEKESPEKFTKDNVEQEKSESDDRVLEKSHEDLPCQSAQHVGVDEVKEIEKISEPQSQDFERIDDVQTSIAYEKEQLNEYPKDGDDDIVNKVVNMEDHVTDLEVLPTIESPLALEERKNATLDQFEEISEPQCQDSETVVDVQTPTHETRLLHVDLNDGDDDIANKVVNIDDYVADIEVIPAIESPLELEECEKAPIEKLVKANVDLQSSEIAPGSADQVQERSLEFFPGQTAPEVDEVEEIEKISEPQSKDFERVYEVETPDVQTPPARETELLDVDEIFKNGANDTADKDTNIEDVADLEVVHAIESPLALEESMNVEKESPEKFAKDNVEQEKSETDDRVLEKSHEDLPCQSAQHVRVDEVKEIEKLSEPQSQDFERIDDVQTPTAYETEQLIEYPKDGDDDIVNKVVNMEDHVTDLEVLPTIESPFVLEERKNATLDQFEVISEPQCQDFETVDDVQTPTHETRLLNVDLNDGDDEIANKVVNIDDYVADIEVVPAIESPFELEECEKAPIEKLVKYNVDLEESEIAPGSDDQVQERSLEGFPGQTAPEVDEVEQIEKISEPKSQDFESVSEVETIDVQIPPARETELLNEDEIYKNGANDTADKGTNIEDCVGDLEVVHAIESPLALEESMNVEKESPEKFVKDNVEQEKSETDDLVLEKSHEDLPCQSAQDVGVDEVKEIEKISEPQSRDFEKIDDVQTPIAYETEQLIEYPKDGDDDIVNKVVNMEDHVRDLEVLPTIESPLALEERKNATLDQFEEISEPQCQDSETVVEVQTPTHETTLLHVDLNDGDDAIANKVVNIDDYVANIEVIPAIESPLELEECEKAPIEKLVKDNVDLESSEIAPGSDDQVQERSLEVFPGQTAPEVDEVEEIEKISEPQSKDFERVYEVETLDVQTPPASDTELLDVDEIYKNGANDTADKGTNIENYVADLEVGHAIESPLALEKSMNVEKESPEKFTKDIVEQEKSETDDRVLEKSHEDLPCQSAQHVGVDEVKEIEKISEPQSQDFERIDDVQTPIAYETEQLNEFSKDGDDDIVNKVVNMEDHVTDLKVLPTIESPLALEERKNATLDQFEEISEPQCQDSETVVDVQTPTHETRLLQVDLNDGDDDIANKVVNIDDYVADIEVVPAIESPFELEECEKAPIKKLVKDNVDLEESEIAPGSDDQVQERSLEGFPGQTAPEVDEVEQIEKISEPKSKDFERVYEVETPDVQTPPAHETELLGVDEIYKNGANDTADKGTNIEDYVEDLKVVHAIESPLALEESMNVEKESSEKFAKDNVEQEKSETDDRVLEKSHEDLPCQSAQHVGVDEVKEIEKISEPQSRDFERIDDVQTPIAYETEQLIEYPKDGDDDIVNKVVNMEDHVRDLEVLPTMESPFALDERKNATLDQFEVISEPQCQDFETVDDVQTPTHETRLLNVDLNDGDDEIANKVVNIDDYVADIEVVPAIESPFELEECEKAPIEKLVKDNVDLEESEIAPGSDDQVQERSLEGFPGQTAPEVDEVEQIEKISEPKSQDFESVSEVETIDVQIPPARETKLLNEDEIYKNGANDTADKGTNIEDCVGDLEVVHAIESPLALEESMNVETENPEKFAKDNVEREKNETDDRVLEKSHEDLPCQSAQHVGVDEVKAIEKISEPQSQDFERTDDVQTPIAYETEQLIEYPKDGDDDIVNKVVNMEDYVAYPEVLPTIESPLALEERRNATLDQFEVISEPQCQDFETVVDVQTPTHETRLHNVDLNVGDDEIANKIVNIDDYVADIEVVPAIESPLELEECEKAPIEKLVKDNVDLEESEIAPGFDDQVQERSLDVFPGKTAPEVDKVEGIEKISEPQSQDFERVSEDETLDVQTPPARETELLNEDEIYKNGAKDTADKGTNIEDCVGEIDVHAIESPLALEESMNVEKEIPEMFAKDNVELEKNETDERVLEKSHEDLPCQSAQHGVDEVKEIEKISEPQSQDFERIDDVQTPIAYETEKFIEYPKDGDDDIVKKVVNMEDYVADLEVLPAIESALALEERKNATLDQFEVISEPQCQDFKTVVDVQTPTPETRLLHVDLNDGDDEIANKVVNIDDYVADIEVVPAIESPLELEECEKEPIEKLSKDNVDLEESEIAPGSDDQVQERSLEVFPGQTAPNIVEEIEKISEPQSQDFERVSEVETLAVQTPPARETELLNEDEIYKNGVNDTADKGTNIEDCVGDLEVVHAIESPLALEESMNVGKESQEKFAKDYVEQENNETDDRVMEKSLISEPQVQYFERVARETVDVQTVPSYEGLLKANFKDRDEIANKTEREEREMMLESTTITEKDGEKVVFPGICEHGTLTEGEDGETNEDVEKKFETQFQDVERVATSEASIINVVTSPQDETGIQGNVVSQEEENETSTIIEKIEIDGEKEETVRKGGDGETSKDMEKIFEIQFQDVERVATSEDASIINVGTSPHYETGLQENEVSHEEENETKTIIEKIEIQDGEKEGFQGICEQGTVTEGGDGETSEDVEKNVESQFQDVERVATSEDDSIINVGTTPQYEPGLQGEVVSQEKEPKTTNTIEKIEIQDGEKEVFQGIYEKGTVTEGGYGETSKDVEKKFETQFQDVERVATSEDASIIDVGTSPQYETGLQVNVVSQEEENETEKIEIQDGEKEFFPGICEQSTVTEGGDGETSEDVEKKFETQFQDVERVATCEDTTIINFGTSPQYEPRLEGNVVSQEGKNETAIITEKIEIQDGEKEAFQGICEQGTVTEGGEGEISEDVEKNFETQFQDVERVATSEYVSIINVGTSPEYETGLGVNVVSPKEENETVTVTENIQIQDEKVSCERSKDVSTNQNTEEPIIIEAKYVSGTYNEDLVNPMEERERYKDVKSTSVKLDLQTGEAETDVSIKPREVLTKEEEPVELASMGNERKLKETNTDSNIPIDNDEENKDQIKKSIDSPQAKNSSPDLLNEERNVDDEYEEVKERFTILEPTKLSLSDLMQKSIRKAPQVADESIQKKELIDNKEEKNEGTEIKHGEEAKTDEENDEGDEHKGQDSGSDAPVMVEASRDVDTKHTPKKSHNILSGVGSKVKHSIAKVKKVITGKSSPHSKPPSPRIDK